MVYTSTNILDSVKRNQTIATSAFRFEDSDLYSMVDEEIESTIVPMILRLHSDRLVFKDYLPLIANKSYYDIPYRAVGSQLRELVIQDSLTSPSWKRSLDWIEYADGQLNTFSGESYGFYFSGDQIILVPDVGTSTTNYLCFSYHIKHSRLVASDAVAIISGVDYTTGIITLTAAIPTTWTLTNYMDFIVANDRSKPHILDYDIQPTAVGTTTLTFSPSSIPVGLVAGDKISLAQQTDVLLLPDECFKYLCKAVEIKIMEAQKDLQAVEAAQKRFVEARQAMESILTPRLTNKPRVIVNKSLMRGRSKRNIGIIIP